MAKTGSFGNFFTGGVGGRVPLSPKVNVKIVTTSKHFCEDQKWY